MPSCGCAGASCGCLIEGGAGVLVSGVGSATNPYVITGQSTGIPGLIKVTDTASLDLTLGGSGSSVDPFVLSGTARQSLTGLSDVNDPGGPVNGEVPVWVSTPTGHWEFRPPAAAAPGTVAVGTGLSGDGSSGAPLRPATSGTWGTAPLNVYGADSLVGAQIYVDSAGQLRAKPYGFEVVADGVRPTQYAGRSIIEATSRNAYVTNGTTWSWLNQSTWDAGAITSGVLPVARIPNLDAAKITTGRFLVDRIPYVEQDTTTGRVYLGTAVNGPGSASDSWIAVAKPNDGTNTFWVRRGSASQESFAITHNGHIMSPDTYTAAIVGGRTMSVNSAGLIGYASSSARYKTDITPALIDPARVLEIEPVTYRAKDEPDSGRRHLGVIAEQVDQVAPELVFYDEQGRPDGVAYEKLAVALLFVLREHEHQIHRLLDQKQ